MAYSLPKATDETGFHHVAQASLGLLDSSNPPTSASQESDSVAQAGVCSGTISDLGSLQPPPPGFKCFLCLSLMKTRFCHVGQAGLELLTSGDLPTSTSQSAGITGISHPTQAK
ncbi:Protein GVQW1, partial [Plecturocebus cupreus]